MTLNISINNELSALQYTIQLFIFLKNRSTGNERHQLLQSILRAEEDNEEEEDEAPDDEVSRQLFYISN